MFLGSAEQRWESTTSGEALIYRPAPNVLVSVFRGNLDAATGRAFGDSVNERLKLATEPMHTFFDTSELASYHSEVRVALTAAIRGNRERLVTVEVLVMSTLVRMGVAVANLALGGYVKSHASSDSFNRAVRAAIAASARK
jgi:hypothetical protein